MGQDFSFTPSPDENYIYRLNPSLSVNASGSNWLAATARGVGYFCLYMFLLSHKIDV